MTINKIFPSKTFALLSCVAALSLGAATDSYAQAEPLFISSQPLQANDQSAYRAVERNANRGFGYNNLPQTIISSQPLPESLRQELYRKPTQTRAISPSEVTGRAYRQPIETLVTRRVAELSNDLYRIQSDAAALSGELNAIGRGNEDWAADYYANVATINTQLQSGTTKGNPRLVTRLSDAENKLENLAGSLVQLNALGVNAAAISSEASFLLEETRAAYSIAGAVEEDHVRLAELEDSIHGTLVIIERLLNTTNDDITRVSTYLGSERYNLRTLALAVTNGDLYGKSLSNRPFSSATPYNGGDLSAGTSTAGLASSSAVAPAATSALSGPRPLAKIRFDRPDVDYQQPVYAAVNEALQRYPNARFDLVAVHPTNGNAAQVAIESTKARRNAEKVLRTLTQMGLPLEQVDLSYSESSQASSNEVHLFVK